MARKPRNTEPHNTVNVSGTMPADQKNGLLGIVDELCQHPGLRRVAVVELYAQYVRNKTDDGTQQAVVYFEWVEPMVEDADAKLAGELMVKAQTSRLNILFPDEPRESQAS